MWVDARSLFSLLSFCAAFFIDAARFLVLMPLNVLLFSFITGFNSNWFIYVGFTNSSLFLSILLKALEMRKNLKHLRAKDGHLSNVKHSELIDIVQLKQFDI
jgi:hypothetical protein